MYFDEPVGRVKIQTTPYRYVRAGAFRRYLFTGNAWQNGIGARNPANWWVNSRTRQTGFCSFDQAITGAIHFTFHNGKKSSFNLPNYTSIQFFHFKISVKKKRRKKEIYFWQATFFFRNSNPIRGEKTCLTGPLWGTNTTWHLCWSFKRYLCSTKYSWIIIAGILLLSWSPGCVWHHCVAHDVSSC